MEKLYAIFRTNGFDFYEETNLQVICDGFKSEAEAEKYLLDKNSLKDGSSCKGKFLILPYWEK